MQMTPPKQAANAANAQLSTGPRTEAGKAISSKNAVQHGLSAKQAVVTEDQRQQYDDLRDRLLAEVDPQGALELETFKILLHTSWNMERFRTLEGNLVVNNLDPLLDDSVTKTLDRLNRYYGQHRRGYHKALDELRTLQTNRQLKQSLVDDEDAKELPALCSIAILLKQARAHVKQQAAMSDYELEQFAQEATLRARARAALQNEPTARPAGPPKEGPNAA